MCDFSLLLDRAYAELNLKPLERRTFGAVYDHVLRELRRPLLLIHLRCNPHVELERVRMRKRREELRLSIDYVAGLNRAVEQQVAAAARQLNVLRIDSGARDFASSKSVRKEIEVEVVDALSATGRRR